MTLPKLKADNRITPRSNVRFVWKRATGLVLLAGALTLPTLQPSFAEPIQDQENAEQERGRRGREGGRREGDQRGPRDRGPEGRGPEGRGARDRGMEGAEMMRRMPIIAALDADRDGKISKDEIENAAVALRKLDKNDDGSLTFDELRPQGDFAGRPRDGENGERGPRRGEGGGMIPREAMENPQQFARMLFERRDANSDDKLTGDEIPEPMQDRMRGIDTNNDDAISREELVTAMQRFGEAGRGGGRENMRGKGRPDAEEGGRTPKRPPSNSDSE
ncbi:secreted protein [Rhodopirellula maiorica SM1]|uniref:Secreted protein n=1 Tax=Rhodopirellula maiorica SM1 TaxID=1265738 RepID=M5S3U9_9BACT|nr:secreted protein [Rhodopirellula maiorica]EMI20854.1 secreted protein [Rhodopirellula maiorica SM1]